MGPQCKVRLLIIADDLTGSNDAGAQFAKRGIPSIVLVSHEMRELPGNYPVVVVNTESRHVVPEEAARRVAHVANLGMAAGVQIFFKKTDSTLRGNIGAELKALLNVSGESHIPFAPAFPEMGRTTRSGVHYVDGVPIAETAFANDPLSPVRVSEIAKVLTSNADLKVANASNTDYRPADAVNCTVFDCESRKQLRAIAECCLREPTVRVLSGSAAFAEELPNFISFPTPVREPLHAHGPVLIVSGSLNPRSLEQVSIVSADCNVIQLTPDHLRGDISGIRLPKSLGARVLLRSVSMREDYIEFRHKAAALEIPESELHHRVASANGQVVESLLSWGGFKTLLIIGGDTLMGITKTLRWTSFEPLGELEAGVTAAKPGGSDLLVISKAGGFGDVEVLRRVLDRIRN